MHIIDIHVIFEEVCYIIDSDMENIIYCLITSRLNELLLFPLSTELTI